jgi:hypothetical protein
MEAYVKYDHADLYDNKVLYFKSAFTTLAVVDIDNFYDCGIDNWWSSKLGQKITNELYNSGSYEIGVYIYDDEDEDEDESKGEKIGIGLLFFNNAVGSKEKPTYAIKEQKFNQIINVIKRRYKDCKDGVLALTSCTSCNDLTKVGSKMENIKCTVASLRLCDMCVYT